jgi:hypothetical protein
MAERNPISSWGNDTIGVAYREQLKKTKESNAVPFGEERLTPSEGRTRFDGMTSFERQRFIAEKGEAAVLDMLRGG